MRLTAWFMPIALGSIGSVCLAGKPNQVCGTTDHFFVEPHYSAAGGPVSPLYTAPTNVQQNALYGGRTGSQLSGSLPQTLSGYRAVGTPSSSSYGGGGGRIAVRFVSTDPNKKPVIARFDDQLNYVDSYIDLDSDNDGLSDIDESRSPISVSGGSVIFKSLRMGQTNVLARYPGGSQLTGTLPSTWYSGATNLSKPAVRPDGGEVVFAVERRATDGSANLTQGLYAGRPGSDIPITIYGNDNYRYSAPQEDATGGVAYVQTDVSSGQSALYYTPRDAASGLATGKRQHSPLRLHTPSDPITFSLSPDGTKLAFVDNGALSLVVSPRDAASGLPTGIAMTVPLVSVGDTIGATTFSSLTLAPESFNQDDGLLYFSAGLADGGSGIFSIAVPEPMTVSALAGAGVLLVRRRR